MAGGLETLREQLEDLGRQVRELRQRVAHLESRAAAPGAEGGRASPSAEDERAAPALGRSSHGGLLSGGTVALLGRTLVVLGGAYFVRAISDRELISPLAGAGIGLLYAAWWLLQCDRSAARGERTSAAFHGMTGAAIAYPLIWDTTLVFELVGAAAASTALVAVFGLGMAVARRRDLPLLAWALVLAHVPTCLALMIGTHDYLPPTLAMLAAAAAVEILAAGDRWAALRWPAAAGADLAAVVIAAASVNRAAASGTDSALSKAVVIAVELALPSLYLASVGLRTLLRARPISTFGIAQVAIALIVGFSGAVRVPLAREGSLMAAGAMALILGAGCYTAAFVSIDRHVGRGRNFYAYTTFAGVLCLVGCMLVLPRAGGALVGVWSALAAGSLALGVSFDRITLKFHGAVYALAAASASGLLWIAGDALLVDPEDWRVLSPLALGGATVALACCFVLLATRSNDPPWYTLLPQTALVALLAWSLSGLAVRALAPLALGIAAGDEGPALVSATRTVTISAVAALLALEGRRWSLRELHWLVYPALGAGGAKLLWEDIPLGEPVALFAALAAYGGVLIAAPRLLRKAT